MPHTPAHPSPAAPPTPPHGPASHAHHPHTASFPPHRAYPHGPYTPYPHTDYGGGGFFHSFAAPFWGGLPPPPPPPPPPGAHLPTNAPHPHPYAYAYHQRAYRRRFGGGPRTPRVLTLLLLVGAGAWGYARLSRRIEEVRLSSSTGTGEPASEGARKHCAGGGWGAWRREREEERRRWRDAREREWSERWRAAVMTPPAAIAERQQENVEANVEEKLV